MLQHRVVEQMMTRQPSANQIVFQMQVVRMSIVIVLRYFAKDAAKAQMKISLFVVVVGDGTARLRSTCVYSQRGRHADKRSNGLKLNTM